MTVFLGGTTALATVYQDIGLIIPAQNPMTSDITGRIPLFYLADGVYRVRLVDQYGMGIFDYLQVASIGASSTGGGGTPVDPTTVFNTGDELFQKVNIPRTGWVRQNGLTIGSGTSGGSERANADCQNLFLFLWNNYTNGHCPVVGGRGVSAAADWAANKQITLPDMRGRTAAGLDGMGNARANIVPDGNVTSAGDTGDTAAATGGEANHLLITGELAAHNHAVNITDTHQHTVQSGNAGSGSSPSVMAANLTGVTNNNPSTSVTAAGSITAASVNAGGGGTHNNMEPFALGTWWIKL